MATTNQTSVDLRLEGPHNGLFKLIIAGRLDSTTTGGIWNRATAAVRGAKAGTVEVDASGVDYCDGAGVALFVQLRQLQSSAGGSLQIDGLRPEFAELLKDSEPENLSETPRKNAATTTRLAEEIGEATVEVWRDIQVLVSFVGELSVGLVYAVFHPRSVRWRDALRVAEAAGVNALPIVALVSFLMGLIMAFQAAIPLRPFGAELFIANLIGLSILRELGPLMTAIILAGRSGSAFAAEL